MNDHSIEQRKEEVAALLLGALEKRNWSYRDLASAAGIGPATVGTHISGRSLPSPATLHKYARALGLPAGHLLVIAGHASPSRTDRPLELVALLERLDELWDQLSPETRLMVSRFIQSIEPLKREQE